MKLYTNGCSFTQGHHPYEDNNFTQSYNGLEYTSFYRSDIWPWQLGVNFEYTFNHGRQATGLDRTIRTTLQFIDCLDDNELEDWIFILQASQYHRKEHLTWESGEELYGQVHPEFNHIPTGIEYRSPYTDDIWVCNRGVDSLSDIAIDYSILWESDVSLATHQLKSLILIQNILKQKNIKYIITGMMRQDLNVKHTFTRPGRAGELEFHKESPLITNLEQHLDTNNIIKSIEEITFDLEHNEYYDPCGHLNSKGQTFLSNYIKAELENRNWLT